MFADTWIFLVNIHDAACHFAVDSDFPQQMNIGSPLKAIQVLFLHSKPFVAIWKCNCLLSQLAKKNKRRESLLSCLFVIVQCCGYFLLVSQVSFKVRCFLDWGEVRANLWQVVKILAWDFNLNCIILTYERVTVCGFILHGFNWLYVVDLV